jgi:hypothetical protein
MSNPQLYSETGQQRTPPLVKSAGGAVSTPQQKIFAKVKAVDLASDLRFYIL